MLVDFVFENFKCYRDETRLSMEAAGIAEHEESVIEGIGNKRLLPVAVVYGPNGGGKSSALQALDCLRWSVTWPWMLMRARKVAPALPDCRPYAFDSETAASPTTFRVVFDAAGYTYRYVLSLLDGVVKEEYLHRRKPGKGATATLFERSGGEVALGSSLRRKGVSVKVDEMMPYISFLAITYDLAPVDAAFNWFLDCTFLDYANPRQEGFVYELEGDLQDRVVSMLNGMDIDITGIRYQHGEDGEVDGVYLTHACGSGEELELEDESHGTIKLLGLVPHILMALERGSVVVSDELDAKLHPKLLRYVIRLFTDKATNPKGAQLVFTSHDMSTLNSATFRRDEIWFAAKDESGSSVLYSLADIVDAQGRRIRTQNAYDRQYLAGQYGADPYLRNMLDWDAYVE